MDIDGVGDKLSAALFRANLVKDAGDLYYLTAQQLIELEKMADKSAANVLKSIEESKNRPLSRVIFALGIEHIGGETAELLAANFNSIEKLAQAPREKLLEIPSIGPKIADSIKAFFRQEQNQGVIEKLKKAAKYDNQQGFFVAAGHGLEYENVNDIVKITEIEELNIGHSIISRAVFVRIVGAVEEMVDIINKK